MIFPESPPKQRIRALGERLDFHRKQPAGEYPGLTLTGMYNVLEKLLSGEPLTAARLSSPNAKKMLTTTKASSPSSARSTTSWMKPCVAPGREIENPALADLAKAG